MRTSYRLLVRWLLLAVWLIGGGAVHAAWLDNVPVTVVQPNGDTLHLFATGDEFYHYMHDAEGYTILEHPVTGYYVYAEKVNDRLVASDYVYGTINPSEKGLRPRLTISDEEYRQRRREWERYMPQNRSRSTNHGTLNNLVVFVRFADQWEYNNIFNQSYSEVEQMFNGESQGAVSMLRYFDQASWGDIHIPSHLYPSPNGNRIVSFKDKYPRDYYRPKSQHNPDGYDNDTEEWNRFFHLVDTVCFVLNGLVPSDLKIDNLQPYDGNVDNVVFVIKGEVDQAGTILWPSRRSFGRREAAKINGKYVCDVNLQFSGSSIYFNVGTFCHEMNHTLGAPDTYHHNNGGYHHLHPVWYWDLQASDGAIPQQHTAYMKMKYDKWISEIPDITDAPGTYTLNALSGPTRTNVAYKIRSSDPNQFYVLEYRNKDLLFDSSVPGKGLIIYRVDTRFEGNCDYNPTRNIYDELYVFRPGGSPTHYNGWDSIQHYNFWNSSTTWEVLNGPDSAYFSAQCGRTSFNVNTDPYPYLTDGTPDRSISIFDISEAGNTISFTYGYKIEVSSNFIPGGTVTGGGLFVNNSTCTITATPNFGYAFNGWYKSVLGMPTIKVSDNPIYTFTVSEHKNLMARFEPANYTITLNAFPTAGGTISGGGSYPAGSVVTVSANANSGYRFNGWVENGQLVATATSYMFVANADRDLIATFVSTQSGIGSVVTNADGTHGVLFHIDPSGVGWMVAMDDVTDGCPWGPETNIGALPDYPWNNMVAVGDLSGLMNTGILRITLGTDNDYAASQVDFDHGWYLPSAGQLRKLYAALPFVDSVLYYHGGSTLSEDTYWSSTEYSSSDAHSTMFAMSNSNKGTNHRVRAIRNYFSPQDNMIIAMPDSPTRGTVMNYHNGVYSYGENAAVVATPKAGYVFDHWSEDGLPVSYNRNYTFTFTHSRQLIAHFAIYGSEGTVIHNADGSDGVVFYMNPEGSDGLMVALEDASAGCQWGTNSNNTPLRDYPVNDMFALNDMSGAHNTGVLRNAQGLDSTYAASVVDYANGWYLPSSGELRKLYAALPLIETALVSAGGTTLTEDTYWSSTEYSTSDALTASFSMSNVSKTSLCRVRAIRKFLTSGAHTLVAKANNEALGTVSGSGDYEYNETVTVSAEPNEGYVFQSWTEDGIVVSHDATWQFPFTRNRVLVANFIVAGAVGEIVHNIDGSTGVVFYQNAEGTEGWMVALEDASVGCTWGPESNIQVLHDYSCDGAILTLKDLSGLSNTAMIRKLYGTNNDYAASVVDFANGWYLPSAGQLRKLYAALPMIEESIINAGGTPLTEDAYWSSSEYSSSDACSPMFAMNSANKTSFLRVRAIRNFDCYSINSLKVKANDVAFGTVSGAGNYQYGATVQVTATPNPNYVFDHWEEEGSLVSYNRNYSFVFTHTRTLVAVFVREYSIGSIVHNDDGTDGIVFYTYPSGIGGLVVALEDVSEGCPWGLNEDITILDNQSPSAVMDLLNDMCGKSNTNRIREWYSGNTEYAACKTDFANGWYLPSAGQLRKLYAVLPMIERAIVDAGGTTMTEDAYWSSTEQSASNAWIPSFAMNSTSKTNNCRVRAIRSLTETKTITANVNIADGGTVTGGGWYDYGQTCTLKAQANESYAFLNWTYGGSVVSTNMEYSFTVWGNQTYTANFVANSSNITTAMDPANSGTVTGAGVYAIGSNCTLTATPHTGYTFTNWTKNGNEVSTQSTYSFTVTESGQYTAHFALNSYEIIATVFPEEGGAVSGAHAYTHGSTAILTALPTEGYTFINWKENGVVVSTSPTYQFVVTGNRTLQANFSNNAYTITAIAYPSDGGTIEGAGVYEYGTVATLTAHANNGYEFFCWFENDDMVSFEPTISFEVAEDVVIYVVFVENENITQTTNLAQGWNWFSTYLDISLDDLKTALVDALGSSTITINSQNNGSTTYNGTVWRGTLNTLDVTQMYKIKVTGDCEIVLAGTMLNPAEHPVIIHNGANWIGFPLNVSMSLNNAFVGFAVSGDMVRSKDGSATYTNQWRGTLNTLVPGQGYIYKSSAAGDRIFTFPASTGKSIE